MRPTILLCAGLSLVLIGGGGLKTQALAAEASKDSTRVAIAVSGGPVAYTDELQSDPPAIIITFRSRNVRAQLEPLVAVNAGLIKEIQSDYYPTGRRVLKSLTLTLVQPAAYTITQQANHILIDIETPPGLLPGRMAIGSGLTILGMEARETLLSRLKAMGDALQHAAPPVRAESVKPKPVVVTQPVQIPVAVVQPAPAPMPVSRKSRGGFWYGLALGIGGTLLAVGLRRRRKTGVASGAPAEVVPMTPTAVGASVYEQLILKAMERQGHKSVGSKAIEGLGTIWIVEKDRARHGVLCLIDGEFFERKVLEQFLEALKQETLPSGTVMALGAFTAPAQAFAREGEIALVAREEVLKMINVELNGPVVEPQAATQLAKLEGELAQAQERIRTLEQELAAKGELYATLSQEADQLKAKSAEVDQRLAAEQEKRTQLETQIARLEEQLKVQGAKETIKAVAAEEPKDTQEVLQGQEHRKWPRLDLSRQKGKGVLVRATSNDGEPMNGDARNISAGGLCVELPAGEALADEFELKLFLPDRTKPIEAIGKLIWKGRSRRRMEQLGVAFSAINAPDQGAISRFVEERTPEPVTVG